MKILMVCLGNICRSPLAEGIMKSKIEEKGLDWEVDSAGTGSWHVGEAPDPRSIAVAQKNGIDIKGQRARQFRASDLTDYDLILAMDSSNYRYILNKAGRRESEEKVQLILDAANPGSNQNVPDPYWNDDGFDQVFELLDAACEGIIRRYNSR